MKEFNIINLNEFTWQLNVAIFGGVFAVFSLINNDYYIYYGLFTAAFGIVGHVLFKTLAWIFREARDEQNYAWIIHVANVLLTFVWLLSLFNFYNQQADF